jgi:hypothetical protein
MLLLIIQDLGAFEIYMKEMIIWLLSRLQVSLNWMLSLPSYLYQNTIMILKISFVCLMIFEIVLQHSNEYRDIMRHQYIISNC